MAYWTTPRETARVHLLPAMRAPVVAVLRRKPNKVWHVMLWDLRRDQLEHGSWFRGTLYPHRCDVSWDVRWLVYLAMGADGSKTWNAVGRLPWLKAYAEAPNVGTWAGGGVFVSPRGLVANTTAYAELSLSDDGQGLPFHIERLDSGGESFPILDIRLERDGWKRRGKRRGKDREIKGSNRYFVTNDGDQGWSRRPSPRHPELQMFYRGYFERGYTFEFVMPGYEAVVDHRVEWANWTATGDLVLTREGVIERYGLEDLRRGQAAFALDLNGLSPPPKPPATPG